MEELDLVEMSVVSVETVIPLRYSDDKNIITCGRDNVLQQVDFVSEQLAQDVKDSIDQTELVINEIYALKRRNKPWVRAMVKFIRKIDGVPVLQLLDVKGLVDFDTTNMNARKIASHINKLIFRKRADCLAEKNGGTALTSKVQGGEDPIEILICGRFNIYEILGEGSYGVVARGRDTISGMVIAMKIFKTTLFGFEEKRKENLEEAEIIRKLDHGNVIKLIDVIDDEMGVFLIFPLMNGTLHDTIYAKDFKCTSKRVKEVATMILNGLVHMNQKKIMHRDLKPSNILVDEHDNLKISDFGLATNYREKQFFMDVCGTYAYMAPEMLLRFGYQSIVDVWSLGCILAEFRLKDQLIQPAKDEKKQIRNILEVLGTPEVNEW
ncbi:cell division control protein 2 homolog 3-like [Sitodiplosis mosellana]|uniref:cell division control protein 2 homolog 3-like n=1 Tax=Sitodiplosis mosellana TaxID=263140 RepID=UPI0024448ADA|nr:cell division control protein 2 homolog 3-like [Sitodiplosis mosellana]